MSYFARKQAQMELHTDDKTIRIDKEAHKKAKLDATKKGKTLKQYLHELIFGTEKPDNEKKKAS